MMTDRALARASQGADALLLNLTLLWRRFRRREIDFTPEGTQFYEDQLVQLRFDLAAIETDYKERFAAAYDLVDRMAGLLRRNLPARAKPDELVEFGELLDRLRTLSEARGIVAAAVPPKAFEGPVYIPEENRKAVTLADDLVVPEGDSHGPLLGGGTLRAVAPDNVVFFSGVRRERHEPAEGGAR